jgi:hypothetical protein
MFTVEESALLGRMLRTVGWTCLVLLVTVASCAVLHHVVNSGHQIEHHAAHPRVAHHA